MFYKKLIMTMAGVALSLLSPLSAEAQPPNVHSVTPTQNDVGVAASNNLNVTFDIDMDGATIGAASFIATGSVTGAYGGTIGYDGPTKTATLNPTSDFRPGELITVTLTTAIQSSLGLPLASSFAWSFTVEADDDPGSFAPHVDYPIGGGAYGVCAGDFNNDTHIDIATANEQSNDISVLHNLGDGTFSPASNYPAGDALWGICAGDFNNDDFLDLAVTARASSKVIIMANDGSGFFAVDSVYSINSGCMAIVAADLNGDGAMDLATVDNGVSVLLNMGDGLFEPPVPYSTGGSGFSLDVADLDGDGDLDIACIGAGNVVVLTNDGTGVFVLDGQYPAGSGEWSVHASDLNGDRHIDLAVANFASNNLSVLLNDGTGHYAPAVNYPTLTRPFSVISADLDADDDLDLLAANFLTDSVSYLANRGDGTFDDQVCFRVGSGPTDLVAADFDGDNDLDVAVSNWRDSFVSILRNQLSLTPNPGEFTFSAFFDGPNPSDQTMTISTNGYDLDFEITSDAPWLSVAESSGITPAATSLQVNIDGLPLGVYTGELTLTSSDPLTIPSAVSVELSVDNWPAFHAVMEHNRGKMALTMSTNGTFGTGFSQASGYDYFTGMPVHSCEYPKFSETEYLFAGALWIGAIVGDDTLVSVGADGWSGGNEMYSVGPDAGVIHRSILDPDSPDYYGAISEQDYVTTYVDTLTEGVEPDYSGRPHLPIGIEIKQTSMAWSYPYAEDFVLIDYGMKNIGADLLEEFYVGFYVDADVCYDCNNTAGYADDISGFLEVAEVDMGLCTYSDTVNLAWTADNDGDFYSPVPARNVTATQIVRAPSETHEFSYNWWMSNGDASRDFGPREHSFVGRWEEEFRDFGTGGIGTPEGDANKYYQMRNLEFDYDQIFAASIDPTDSLWMYPNQSIAPDFSDGFDTRYLLSFGPFDLAPGQTLPLAVAYVGGEDLHTDPGNIANLPDQPDEYLSNLNFSDLVNNAMWASWIYDNPGVDTDDDGYFGKFILCGPDTIWVKGDGVPDFRGASPPPAPRFWLEPGPTSLSVRINGLRSETTRDMFSRNIDFEGYRVYLSPDGTPQSLAQVATFDRENYVKYVYIIPQGRWESRDYPFSIDSLRCMYGDSCSDLSFDPLAYTQASPYIHPDHPDSIFYFTTMAENAFECGVTTAICKIYPYQPYPSGLDPDSVHPSELTPDGYLKYFEYQLTIDGLIAGHCYAMSVTAFDFGNPASGVPPLESSRYDGVQTACTGQPNYSCGDINASGDQMDISDLIYLIDYMFTGGPPPPSIYPADVNCDGVIDISDLVLIIDYMFRDGPPLECCDR